MEKPGLKYNFTAKPWKYTGPASWTFISLPKNIAKEIRENLKSEEQGWGRLKATAKIGNTEWNTAIWFDSKMNTYLLPLKTQIRKKECIEVNKNLSVTIWI
jgi:hypothetical protein